MIRILARGRRSRARPPRRAARAALFDRAVAELFMRLALREAAKGLGRTSPNPAVGAVLVRGGRVIARGHHARAGGPHAEVVALRAAGGRARGADLYTTLEPCDHYGKTPPCSIALLDAGVRGVFVGSADPNPLVNGKGIARLRAAGVEVVEGVLRPECDALNAHWFKLHPRAASVRDPQGGGDPRRPHRDADGRRALGDGRRRRAAGCTGSATGSTRCSWAPGPPARTTRSSPRASPAAAATIRSASCSTPTSRCPGGSRS